MFRQHAGAGGRAEAFEDDLKQNKIMQFHWGGIPKPKGFIPDESWKSLREPGPWMMQLFAIPLGVVAFIAIGALWFYRTETKESIFKPADSLATMLGSFVVLVIVHELIHAMVHPQLGRSSQSILGFWPLTITFLCTLRWRTDPKSFHCHPRNANNYDHIYAFDSRDHIPSFLWFNRMGFNMEHSFCLRRLVWNYLAAFSSSK